MLDSKARDVMIESKTKDDIMLEEKIAKIDDFNFDRIYDVNEFANKQLETFDNPIKQNSNLAKISNYEEEFEYKEDEVANSFELEIQPNEFLDNMVWEKDEEEEENSTINFKKPKKFQLQNKSLFFAFTSIAFLLCILFIYNIFVIKSLEGSVANINPNANISNVETIAENNYISFENSSTLEIEKKDFTKTQNNELQTNWFDRVCTFLNHLFGGNY